MKDDAISGYYRAVNGYLNNEKKPDMGVSWELGEFEFEFEKICRLNAKRKKVVVW